MGNIEIIDKLRKSFENPPDNEYIVVYILSRIRKVIELQKLRGSYKLLVIYCHWSLHTKIDKTEGIKDKLQEFVQNKEARTHFLYLNDFKSDLKTFAKQLLDIDLTPKYLDKFADVLREIISDTPISYKIDSEYTITINPKNLPRSDDQITYSVSVKVNL